MPDQQHEQYQHHRRRRRPDLRLRETTASAISEIASAAANHRGGSGTRQDGSIAACQSAMRADSFNRNAVSAATQRNR